MEFMFWTEATCLLAGRVDGWTMDGVGRGRGVADGRSFRSAATERVDESILDSIVETRSSAELFLSLPVAVAHA